MDVRVLGQQLAQQLQSHQIQTQSGDFLEITPLGAGCEVGRSCIYLECKGKKIMLDCGIHPGKDGVQALPYFDVINPKELDLILITHFHVDHCAGLPYFLEKTDFKGKVYMTHPTKSIYNYVMQDFVKVSNIAIDEKLFDENDLKNTLDKIYMLDYHQEVEENGIKFSCYRAGHVLGASMFLIEIDGVKILYTGDYSREEDRHLKPAELPNCEVDVLIVESTYGVQIHEQRDKREERFTKLVHDIVKRGGKCLLPVFALGRAQEILLILNEYWQKNPDIQNVPIYYSGSLAQKSLTVFQTYRNMMGDQLRMELESGNNPFHFEPITTFNDDPGMLQNGQSRDLFVKWAPDPKNGIVFTGYSVEGTLAKSVMNRPKILTVAEQQVELKLSVEYISFSAHADYQHTSEYIKQLQPPNIVLVHGDANEMKKLQNDLQARYKDKIKILTPKNCQQVRLKLISKKSAKIIGQLARQTVENLTNIQIMRQSHPNIDRHLQIKNQIDGDVQMIDTTSIQNQQEEKVSNYVTIDGIFIKQDFDHLILDEEEIDKYTTLTKSTMKQTIFIPFKYDIQVLNFYIYSYFADVKVEFGKQMKTQTQDDSHQQTQSKFDIKFIIDEEIALFYFQRAGMLQLEWITSPKSDLVADSLSLLVLQINEKPTPQLLNLMDQVGEQRSYQEFVQKLYIIMENHFDQVSMDVAHQQITIVHNEKQALIDLYKRDVQADDQQLQETIQSYIKHLEEVHAPVDLKHC